MADGKRHSNEEKEGKDEAYTKEKDQRERVIDREEDIRVKRGEHD